MNYIKVSGKVKEYWGIGIHGKYDFKIDSEGINNLLVSTKKNYGVQEGDIVTIEGRLKVNEFEFKDGRKGRHVKVNAEKVDIK